MNKVYITIRRGPIPAHFNVDFEVFEDQALNELDVGPVSCIALRPDRIKGEIEGYKSLGYTPSVNYQTDQVMDEYLREKQFLDDTYPPFYEEGFKP